MRLSASWISFLVSSMLAMSVCIDAPDGFSVLTMRSSSAASDTKSSIPVPPPPFFFALPVTLPPPTPFSRSACARSRLACCAKSLRSISAICSATATISDLMSSMRRLSSAGSFASSAASISSSSILSNDPEPEPWPPPAPFACFMDSESISFLDALVTSSRDDLVRSGLSMSSTVSSAVSAAPYAASLAFLPKMLRMNPRKASGFSSLTPASSSSC